ncbi:MAG: hypothetical protein P8I31_03540, partial [Bacteroidia bacterium]|nr:hypothetical protein [Bacteroidia bacterium]
MINYFLSILFFTISFSEYIDSPENQNRIVNAESLQLFFEELAQIKSKENKVVSVVHIGDSHIQANYLTVKVRTLFQNNFGNAGRGVVFPYKIAGSYGPNDVQFSYDGDWEYCSIKKDFESNQIGLVGYSVSPLPNAELSINVLYHWNLLLVIASQIHQK